MSDLVVRQSETLALYSVETTAELTGVDQERLRQYCELGLLGQSYTQPGAELAFDEDAIYELRRIEHLRHHFGFGLGSLPMICDLLREIERLRSELRHLRD